VHPHARLDAIGADDLPPGLESFLEGHDAGLRQRDLDGFEDFLRRDAEVQRDPDVTLDVPLGGPHRGERRDEDELLGAPVEQAIVKVRASHEVVGRLQDGEVVLGHDLVVVQDVASGPRHIVDVRLGVFH
jgi:hypothetical protein